MLDLVVDNFAGGGGASTGIEWALGRSPDIAVNHCAEAIAMHEANHPSTKHFREDVWQVKPAEVCEGRPVALMWMSPDCTHFSRAKGGKPRSKKIRALAWLAIRWAKAVKPRVIVVENVEEFLTWGPLDNDGNPDPAKAGRTFKMWCGRLRALGYTIEHRLLVAADFGAPTSRKRLFIVARCDGQPIRWPAPTHGPGRAKPWRTAAEVIDWSLPCPSIFGRKRPLADATLRRIAAGVRRYVIESPRPFIVPVKTWGGGGNGPRSLDEPMRTVTASKRGEFALVSPFIAPVTHTTSGDRVHPIDAPLRTVTTAKGGEFVLVSPTLIQTGYGEREGQAPRSLDLHKPLGTVVAGGQKHALVAAFLAKHYGGAVGQSTDRPVGTVTAVDHHSLVTAQLGLPGVGDPPAQGFPHAAEVRAFLVKYYGADGTPASQQSLFDPLHTVTAKARFGLVTVEGEDYQIVDIGMRMLTPRELFAAQGFPPDYAIEVEFEGRPLSKTAQIARAGNSVCPPVAAAIVAANLGQRVAMEAA